MRKKSIRHWGRMVEFDQLGRRVEESEAVRRRAWLGAVLRHPGPALRGRTTVRSRANAARSTLSLVVTALVLATTLVALPGTAGAAGAGFTSDDFSGAGLDPRWSVVDPRGDGDVSVVGTGTTDARLSLSVPAGSGHDAWTPNDSLRVTQPVTDDDLAIDAKFDSVPTKRYQMQGISIHQDQNTWLARGLLPRRIRPPSLHLHLHPRRTHHPHQHRRPRPPPRSGCASNAAATSGPCPAPPTAPAGPPGPASRSR